MLLNAPFSLFTFSFTSMQLFYMMRFDHPENPWLADFLRPLRVVMINTKFWISEGMIVDGWSKKAVRKAEREEGYDWEDGIVKLEGVIVGWMISVVGAIILTVAGKIMTKKITSLSSDYTVIYANWFKS